MFTKYFLRQGCSSDSHDLVLSCGCFYKTGLAHALGSFPQIITKFCTVQSSDPEVIKISYSIQLSINFSCL